MLDIRYTTFITVAKIKSFTKAAEILNLTQPAVSQHIKHLEEYYGVNLIKKQGKEIDLTEEGIILYSYSKELELLHRNLESELKNKSSIHKVYNVGASMTIGGYVLPYILAEYKKAYKNIDIRLQVGNTEEIINKLLNRKIELALIEENLGYTIISKETIKREIKLGVIKIIPIEGLKIYREFNFLYQKDGNKDLIEDFIKFCYISG